MKLKKYLACLTAVLMMGVMFTACSGSSSETEDTSGDEDVAVQDAPETAPEVNENDDAGVEDGADAEDDGSDEDNGAEEVSAIDDADIEPAYSAESGQAYLAIVDSQWWIQYWGSATSDGYMLSYNAGIADIDGDGSYTVSVTADTNGFRYDTTGDITDQYTPEGLTFLAVMIPDGEELYPGAIITVDSILVDGEEIEMTAKNYTSSDDGIETRTNLYNSYITVPSDDARTLEGNLFDGDGNMLDIASEYSPQLIDVSDFTTWTTVEVNFTITGTDGSLASSDAEDADAEDADSDAEEADAE